MLRTRANILVAGPPDMIEPFSVVAREELRPPIARVSAAEPLRLEPAATLMIEDIHLLDAAGQSALAEWMKDPANAETQIISLAPVRVFPLVKAGTFDADLYYRLNTILLELTDTAPES